jgi:hypothetical protein
MPAFTCSFGIVDTGHSRDLAELIRLADVALYRAKHAGRDRAITMRDLPAFGEIDAGWRQASRDDADAGAGDDPDDSTDHREATDERSIADPPSDARTPDAGTPDAGTREGGGSDDRVDRAASTTGAAPPDRPVHAAATAGGASGVGVTADDGPDRVTAPTGH